MAFYGYSPKTKDYSGIANAGQIAAGTISSIPGAIKQDKEGQKQDKEDQKKEKEYEELLKARTEGRIANDDIYNAVKGELSGMKDEDVQSHFGRDKQTLLKMVKPSRNEGTEYLNRVAKVTSEGLKKYHAIQDVIKAQKSIEAVGRNKDVEDEVGVARLDQTFKAGGMDVQGDLKTMDTVQSTNSSDYTPLGNYASPEQVQQIGRRHNVSADQLAPEMSKAKNIRAAGQLRGLDRTDTRAGAMQTIGGSGEGVEPLTMSAIGSLPTETQEAQSIISASKAKTDQMKAVTAQNAERRKHDETKTDSIKELRSLKKTYDYEIKTNLSALDDIDNTLSSPQPWSMSDEDWEKERKKLLSKQKTLTRDLMNARKEVNTIKKEIGSEVGIDIGTEISDKAMDAYDVFTEGQSPHMQGAKESDAQKILRIANEQFGVNVPITQIQEQLKLGAKPIKIFQVFSEMR